MYRATIQFGQFFKGTFKGKTLPGLLKEIEKEQDLNCLVTMGMMHEDEDGLKEIRKLMDFLKKVRGKQATIEDFKNLDIDLSIGRIRCLDASQE